MGALKSPFIYIPQSTGGMFQVTGGIVTCKLSGRENGATYSLWETTTASANGPRPHRHLGQDEDFYVLEGEVQFASGDETVTVHPGDFVRVPHGTVHRYTVSSEQPCRMLIVLTPPGGIEDFWREIGTPVVDPHPLQCLQDPPTLMRWH